MLFPFFASLAFLASLADIHPYRLLFPELNGRLSPSLWDIQLPPNGESLTQETPPDAHEVRWRGKTVSNTKESFLLLAGYAFFETPDTGWTQGPAGVAIARQKQNAWKVMGRHKLLSSASWTDIRLSEVQSQEKRLLFIVIPDWLNPKGSRSFRDGYLFEWTGKKLISRFTKRIFSGKAGEPAQGHLRFSTRPWSNGFPILHLDTPDHTDRSYEWKGKTYQEIAISPLRFKAIRKPLPRLKNRDK